MLRCTERGENSGSGLFFVCEQYVSVDFFFSLFLIEYIVDLAAHAVPAVLRYLR